MGGKGFVGLEAGHHDFVTLQVDQEAFRTATALAAEIRQALSKEYVAVQADVEDLLASWGGDAASQFGGAWAEWCEGMGAILEAIGLEQALLGVVRAQVSGTDADQSRAIAVLHQRLGGGA